MQLSAMLESVVVRERRVLAARGRLAVTLNSEGIAGLLQVRNGQLEKEARELRAENATLQSQADKAKHSAESGEKVSIAPPPAPGRMRMHTSQSVPHEWRRASTQALCSTPEAHLHPLEGR